MPALSEYTNVYGTALAHLEELGFQLWRDPRTELFCAERGGWDFMAESPVALLGLVKIFELTAPAEWREYWWRHPTPRSHTTLPTVPTPYVPTTTRPVP